MLTQSERDQVTEYLLRLATPQNSARSYLLTGLHFDLQVHFPEGSPATLVELALDLCERDAWLHTPPAMVTFLSSLLGVLAFPNLDAILKRIAFPPPPPPSPFDAILLDTKRPFLERSATREYLRAWASSPLKRVVVINGGEKRGKTYTTEYVDHLCNYLNLVQHCVVTLPPKQGASTGAPELARDLVARMGGDVTEMPPANTNRDRWSEELATWVLSVAGKGDMRWWFVLDGFNNRELRDDTGKFIAALATGLGTGIHRLRHRLLLLDFDRTLLTVAPGHIGVDTVGSIPASAVEKFVDTLLQGKNLNADAMKQRVLDGLPDPIDDLPELAERLENLVSVVEG